MNKKIAVLCSVLLLSMAFAGVSYAHWKKVITINGWVETGILDLEVSLTDKYLGYYGESGWDLQEKPIAYWGRLPQDPADDTVYIRLQNVYPCLWTGFTVELENIGTIPAGLVGIDIDAGHDATLPDGSDMTFTIEGPYVDPEMPGYMHLVLMNQDCQEFDGVAMDIWIRLRADDRSLDDHYMPEDSTWPFDDWPGAPDNSLCQIDPYLSVYVDVIAHFDECLPQETEFWFTVAMEYWNWNEANDPLVITYNNNPL